MKKDLSSESVNSHISDSVHHFYITPDCNNIENTKLQPTFHVQSRMNGRCIEVRFVKRGASARAISAYDIDKGKWANDVMHDF